MGLPVERKVQASTAAAAASGLLLWAAGRYVFKGSVPDVVVSWVYVIVPSVITFMAGYAAKHTPRPVIMANTTATPDDVARFAAAMKEYEAAHPGGYSAGGHSRAGPPPPSVTVPEEKTLAPPAAPE